jgi:hypothetical protein
LLVELQQHETVAAAAAAAARQWQQWTHNKQLQELVWSWGMQEIPLCLQAAGASGRSSTVHFE